MVVTLDVVRLDHLFQAMLQETWRYTINGIAVFPLEIVLEVT